MLGFSSSTIGCVGNVVSPSSGGQVSFVDDTPGGSPNDPGTTPSDPNDPSTPSPTPTPADPSSVVECLPAKAAPAPQRVWMLTPEQINATATMVDASAPTLVTNVNRTYFGNASDYVKLGTASTEELTRNVETFAAALATSLLSASSCNLSDAGCFSQHLTPLVAKSWRIPESEVSAQVTSLHEVFAIGAESSDQLGLSIVLEAVLRSPLFLFRTEVGTAKGDGTYQMTGYEVAAFLSYGLADVPPDATLLALAADGSLVDDQTVLAAQVERLLASSEASDLPGRFVGWLTELDQYVGSGGVPAFEELSGESAEQMLSEAHTFANQVLSSGGWSALHTTPNPTGGTGLMSLRGLMARLAAPNSVIPTRRGFYMLNRFLCEAKVSRPNLPDDAPGVDPDLTGRERYAILSAEPTCASCHTKADPIGFAFDKFDWAGRKMEDPSIDTTGEVVGTVDADGSFSNETELAQLFADSKAGDACLNKRLVEYLEGRELGAADSCRLAELYAAVADETATFNDIVKAAIYPDIFTRSAVQ